MAKRYTLLDHTADLRIRVVGADRAELYKNAALALFDLIGRPGSKQPVEVIAQNVEGSDPADLMVNFLRELLYLWTGHAKWVSGVTIGHVSDTAISARVAVVDHQPQRHMMLHDIKAVTYHCIDVRPTPDGWQAEVVFDV